MDKAHDMLARIRDIAATMVTREDVAALQVDLLSPGALHAAEMRFMAFWDRTFVEPLAELSVMHRELIEQLAQIAAQQRHLSTSLNQIDRRLSALED